MFEYSETTCCFGRCGQSIHSAVLQRRNQLKRVAGLTPVRVGSAWSLLTFRQRLSAQLIAGQEGGFRCAPRTHFPLQPRALQSPSKRPTGHAVLPCVLIRRLMAQNRPVNPPTWLDDELKNHKAMMNTDDNHDSLLRRFANRPQPLRCRRLNLNGSFVVPAQTQRFTHSTTTKWRVIVGKMLFVTK